MSLKASGGLQRTLGTWEKLGVAVGGAKESLRAIHMPDS